MGGPVPRLERAMRRSADVDVDHSIRISGHTPTESHEQPELFSPTATTTEPASAPPTYLSHQPQTAGLMALRFGAPIARTALGLPAMPRVQIAEARDRQIWAAAASAGQRQGTAPKKTGTP
jgi:hypothetical protein